MGLFGRAPMPWSLRIGGGETVGNKHQTGPFNYTATFTESLSHTVVSGWGNYTCCIVYIPHRQLD